MSTDDRSDSPDRVKGNANSHSSITGTLLSATAATTSAFHQENNNNEVKAVASTVMMTPPAQRKLGTSNQTVSPNDPRLSYPFCPYKVENNVDDDDDDGEVSLCSGKTIRLL